MHKGKYAIICKLKSNSGRAAFPCTNELYQINKLLQNLMKLLPNIIMV